MTVSSFPFLGVARMRGLPYDIVLRIADHIDGRRPASQDDIDCIGISDYDWIKKACVNERIRRKEAR